MTYPENLKIGDTIGICAPSDGIIDPFKQKRLDYAIENLKTMGYKVIETESVRKSENGRSTSSVKRAKEFMQLLENDDIKLIIFATGGDFSIEILEHLDFKKLNSIKPKWIQGYSDVTSIEFLFNTLLDVPSIYGQTIKDYAMEPLHQSLISPLELASGREVIQKSFDKYEGEFGNDEDPKHGYNFTKNVEWKNVTGQSKIEIHGRALGGCLDVIKFFFGTKYDNINNYIEKYKDDGIIWYFDCFEMSTPELYRILWQMKNSDYFKNCNGIIFGRPLFIREDYNISFNQTVLDVLGDLNIPIICDADIGHRKPQLAIVNGAVLNITSENGKGIVKTYLKK